MGIACRIINTDEGVIALDSNGNTSDLFVEMAVYLGDRDKALDLWALTHTEEFKTTFGGRSDKMAIEDVVAYLDTITINKSELSPAERVQIEDLMSSRGINSLSDLRDILNGIFKPNGFLEIDQNLALDSGLYSQEDIQNIDLVEAERILNKIEGDLAHDRDFSVAPSESDFTIVKSDSKTILGTSEVVGLEPVRNEVIDKVEDFSSEEDINRAIQDSSFRFYTDRYNEDEGFRNSELERYKSLTRVPTLYLDTDGNITDENQATYKTLKNTISTDLNTIEIESDLDFLEEIPQEVWNDKKEAVKEVLKEVELNLADYNIDLVGISSIATERDNVLSIIQPLRDLIYNVNDTNIRAFAEAKDGILPGEKSSTAKVIPEKYRSLNIVKVNSRFNQNELYQLHGLIKIQDNLYHKVQRMEDTSTAYELLYDRVVADEMSIPQKFVVEKDYKNPENKIQVLKDLSKWMNSRDTGVDTEFQEEVSLYQVIFDHNPIAIQNTSKLNQIETDVDYLKGDFVADFYSYYLKEKAKDSSLYRSTLSMLSFNDSDIELTQPIGNLGAIEMSQELSDYFRLKKAVGTEYLFSGDIVLNLEDLSVLNNPSQVKEFNGEVIEEDGYLLTEPISDMYVRHNGQLYRKGIRRTDVNLYVAVDPITDPNYNTENLNFEFDTEQAEEILNRYPNGVESVTVSTEQFDQKVKDAGIENLTSTRFQVVGQEAILTPEMETNLSEAKRLASEGLNSIGVELETGWFQEDGKWKYFSKKTLEGYKIKEGLEIEAGKEFTLSQLIDNPMLFKLYPDIAKTKIKFYDETTEGVSQNEAETKLGFLRGGSIFLNILEGPIGPELISELGPRFKTLLDASPRGGGGQSVLSGYNMEIWQSTILHEVSHLVATKEGFSQGGESGLFEGVTRTRYPFLMDSGMGLIKEEYKKNKSKVSENDKPLVEAFIEIVEAGFVDGKFESAKKYAEAVKKYELLVGEVEARTLEYILNNGNIRPETTFRQFRDELLEKENLLGEKLIPYKKSEIYGSIESALKQSGLSTNIYTLPQNELLEKLEELGVDEQTRRQVIAWHGTQNKAKDLTVETFKNKDKYGELLSGTYYGDKVVAAGFAGVYNTSKLFKASINEIEFAKVDMEGQTPRTDAELIEFLGQEKYSDLLSKKRSGEIKGVILENSFEENYPLGTTTQYLVFNPDTVAVIDEYVGERLEEESMDTWLSYDSTMVSFQKSLAENGVSLVTQGFVHNNEVYINQEAVDPVNTLIHEHGHLFNTWAKENKPEIYKRGIELIKKEGKEYVDYVKKTQPSLKGEALYEEALTQTIGDAGARIADQSRRNSITQWLTDLWESIRETLGITKYTAEQLQTLNLQQFTEAVNAEVLTGEFTVQGNRNTRRQIVSEVGASRVPQYKESLNVAKGMESRGVPLSQIELETKWYKFKGQWRRMSPEVVESFNIKENTENEILSLKKVLGDENKIFDFYPELDKVKVVFLGEGFQGVKIPDGMEQANGAYNEGSGTIFINTRIEEVKNSKANQEYILAHEIAHVVQQIEGLPKGGGTQSLIHEAVSILGIKSKNLAEIYSNIQFADTSKLTKNQKMVVEDSLNTLEALVNDRPRVLENQYMHLMGEIDANVVEGALKVRDQGGTETSYSNLLSFYMKNFNINPEKIYLVGNGNISFDIPQQKGYTPSNTLSVAGTSTFYHGSDTKIRGKLYPATAPQFGTGIYFTTNRDIAESDFGENITEVQIEPNNPVYTNTKEWSRVEKKALEKSNEGKETDEDGDIMGEEYDLAEIDPDFISDAALELGYDVIVDEGSVTYENEIVVLDEGAIVYPGEKGNQFDSPTPQLSVRQNINNIAQTTEANFKLVDPQDKSDITCVS